MTNYKIIIDDGEYYQRVAVRCRELKQLDLHSVKADGVVIHLGLGTCIVRITPQTANVVPTPRLVRRIKELGEIT